MVQLLTNGVVDYLLKKWLSREFRDWTFTEADSIGVTIGHVSGLLVVLGLSVVFAAAVMFAELVTAGANRSVDQVPFRNVIDRCNYNRSSGRVTTYGGARWRNSWGR
ncbi:unnamed protein product [Macrosiphum euphorbiae]|uniref:Uncharacterized protein n=1 Tax=Macrosiphum euphorbiae TaxID=13131 RepID=A0AAV0X9N0_9HEMI|nr:unnamed protein product [Macrosiphum euphorbiae]